MKKDDVNIIPDNINTFLNNASNENFNFHNYLLYHEEISGLNEETKESIIIRLLSYINGISERTISIYSIILNILPKSEYIESLLDFLLSDNALSWEVLNHCYQQVCHIFFAYSDILTPSIQVKTQKLQLKIFELCSNELNYDLAPIPYKSLNKNLAVIITEQFLRETHGPTKIVLNYSLILKQKLGMQVMIINTTECTTAIGGAYWVPAFKGNIIPELENASDVSWGGETFNYFQCPQIMPNIEIIKMLLDTIKKLKPSVVINIGGEQGIFSGFVNKLIPTVCASLAAYYTSSLCDYRFVTPAFYDKNKLLLNSLNVSEKSLIPIKTSYTINPQTTSITRAELGIPQESFVLAVIGWRLDSDITEKFLSTLDKTLADNSFILFVGKYKNYDDIKESHAELYDNSVHLEPQPDILAIYDICDLFINPYRQGGGTSAFEAMYKGVPVISTNYGDIASVVGDQFLCNSLDDYPALIHKYYTDIEFYIKQVQNAKTRAAEFLNNEENFKQAVEKYNNIVKTNSI